MADPFTQGSRRAPTRLVALVLAASAGLGLLGAAQQRVNSSSPQYQEVIAHWSGLTVTTVDAARFGAKGDGAVATDCSIAAASTTLTCASTHFTPADVGKAIAVEHAGHALPAYGMVQPLATTIAAVASPSSVRLARAAEVAGAPAPRVVWGSDDTAALQAAVDALATWSVDRKRGGVLTIRAGRYLTRGLALPCARTGTLERGRCSRTYNNIWIKGAGPAQTVLENWDPDTPRVSVIRLGEFAGTPHDRMPNAPLAFVAITDLAVRQVPFPTQTLSAIRGDVTDDVWLLNLHVEGYSNECVVDGHSRRWRVSDNVLGPCGHGGPSYQSGTAALNLTGWNWIASRNRVTDSPQVAEVGGYHWLLEDNDLTGGAVNASGGVVGSADGVIRRNRLTDSSIGVTNVIGRTSHTEILDNIITNGEVAISSGLDENAVVTPGYATGPAHGTSIIKGNRFLIDKPLENAVIRVGFVAHKYTDSEGLESVVVESNTVTFSKMFVVGGPANRQECRPGTAVPPPGACRVYTLILSLSGPYGARAWRPMTNYPGRRPLADTSHVVPAIDNGFMYVATTSGTSGAVEPVLPTTPGATVRDGTVVWENDGSRPRVTLRNNHVTGPPGAESSLRDVVLGEGTDRDALVAEPGGLVVDFPWHLQHLPESTGVQETVPAGAMYSDVNRYATSMPRVGTYAAGTLLHKVRPWSVDTGWVVTRAGRAAPARTNGSEYPYGAFVVPGADNGHVYLQTTASKCRSAATGPVWPTSHLATIRDGTCVWREAGASAQLRDANAIAFETPFDGGSRWAVISTQPASGARGAPSRGVVAARFNGRAADDAAFSLDACAQPDCSATTPVTATATWGTDRQGAQLKPAAALEPLRRYRATIRSGGRAMSWTFDVAAPDASPRAAYSMSPVTPTTTADASRNGNTATLVGGASVVSDGRFGSALHLDGVDDQLVAPDSDTLSLKTALTFEAWLYPTSAQRSGAIVHKQGSYTLALVDGRPRLSITTTGKPVYQLMASPLPRSSWTHLAVTFDGTTVRMYVNGVAAASAGPLASGTIAVTDAPLEVGGTAGQSFAGRLDEVRIYGRALGSAEILRDMNAPIPTN